MQTPPQPDPRPDQSAQPSPSSQPAPIPPAYPTTPPPNPTPAPVKRPFHLPPWTGWAVGGVFVVGIAAFFLFFWRGELSVTVTPSTATVSIGETSGVGALTQTVVPGLYTVRSEAAGFIPYQRELTIARDESKTLSVDLRPLPEATKLADSVVQFMALDQERQSLLYLVPSAKRVERLSLRNPNAPSADAITPDRFSEVKDFVWSPNRQLAFYREGGTLRQYDFNRYDLVNQTVTDWPSQVQAVDWRPDGEKVAYVYADSATGERTLVRAGRSNEDPERIYNFGSTAITNPQIRWAPDGKSIAIWEKNLFVLDVFSAELRQLDVGATVTNATWSPTSDRLLFQTETGSLGTVKLDGTKDQTTLTGPIARAAFSGDGSSLITAKGRGASLELSKLELATGAVTPLYIAPSSDLDPTDLIISADNSTLYFTSAGHPYRLTIDNGQYADN